MMNAGLRAVLAMGHGIGAAVIAEGIHTEDEALALQTMGIDWGQGYLLARPAPVAEIAAPTWPWSVAKSDVPAASSPTHVRR